MNNEEISMHIKKSLSLLGVALGLGAMQVSLAGPMTNKIKGVGPSNNLVNPYICIQNSSGQVTYVLAPGQTVDDASKYSGNPYYVGATLRFGGCTEENTYLGYMGFGTNSISYSPPQGVHIKLSDDKKIDSAGNVTGSIQYTSIAYNPNLVTPKTNNSWDFVGINLSGLEFGKVIDPVVVPNLSAEDAAGKFSDLNEVQSFINAGMNTIRVPISWGYLQLDGPGKGELNKEYFDSYVKPLLETLTNAKTNAIVDLHAYMRYSTFGKEYSGCNVDGKCPDGTLIVDPNAYIDVWTKLYTLIKNDNKINMNYILFDLMNEPVDVPNKSVFTIQAKVINALRQRGFQGYILVEGNSWSGLHSWTTERWTGDDGVVYTNATLFTKDNFAKEGVTDLSKIIINAHQYLDSDYSGTHNTCQTELKTTGEKGFNLDAFRDYLQQNQLKAIVTEFGGGTDSSSCRVAMTSFLNYMKDNSAKKNNNNYGFVGWTIWSAGHGWGNYNLRVTPASYQMQVLKNYL